MEKRLVDDKDWTFPPADRRITLTLTSLDKRENFMFDVTRAQIKLTKSTYQNRARQAIILMRLDLDGPPHRNPGETDGAGSCCVFAALGGNPCRPCLLIWSDFTICFLRS